MIEKQHVIFQTRQNNYNNILFAGIVAFSSIVASLIMVFGCGTTGIYEYLFLLPICYGGLFFLTVSTVGRNIFGSLVTILLSGGYFIKMVLTPLIFAVGGYKSFIPGTFSEASLNKALVFMCLETTVVFLAMHLWLKKSSRIIPVELKLRDYSTRKLNLVVFFLFAFLVFAYVTIPAISQIYIFLPIADFSEIANIRWDNETIVARGSMERYIYTLFCFLWPIVRLVVPSLMIVHFNKKYKGSKFGMFLAFCCLLLPAILLGGDNIGPFIGIFVGIVVINKLYGKKARKWITVIGIATVVLLMIVVISKMDSLTLWKGASGIAVVAQMLHNYFPGFDNMAVTFDMTKDNIFSTAFFDLYYAIPFRNTLFGLKGKYIGDLFEEHTMTGGQIVPFAGQFQYYFSFFSVLLVPVFVNIAYSAENRSRKCENFWWYFINMYISIYTAMSLSIYSFSIYLSSMVNVVLPVYIVCKLVKRRRDDNRN